MTPPALPPFLSGISITFAGVLHILFAVMIILTGFATAAFYYNWGRFAPSHFGSVVTISIYTGGLLILVLALLGIMSTV